MKFKCLDTKTDKEYIYSLSEVKEYFGYNCTWYDYHILKSEYEEYIKNNEKDKEDIIKFYEKGYIYDNEREYYKDLIEYEKWTSPKGVVPKFKVIEIIE